ncbi:MAG: hypothetical protein ACR2QF_10195 [Geminicoccaceae bacterium]
MPRYIVHWEGQHQGSEGSEEFEAKNDEEAEEMGREIALNNFSWGVGKIDEDNTDDQDDEPDRGVQP